MLRDDQNIQLNAVLVACQKTADHYAQAAELTQEVARSARLEGMWRVCRKHVQQLTELVREVDYLPAEPDHDKQDFAQALTHARSTLAADSQAVFQEKALDLEDELQQKAIRALEAREDNPAEELLRKIVAASRGRKLELTQQYPAE
jgi:uncharacterized hydantoinase/oxoprolinase family protein